MKQNSTEKLIIESSVKITVKFLNEKKIHGSGTVFFDGIGPIILITAKHCLFEENKQGVKPETISKLSISKTNSSLNKPNTELKNGDFSILLHEEEDIAIIIINDQQLCKKICEKEQTWNIGKGSLKHGSNLYGFGYPKQSEKFGGQKYGWKYWQEQEKNNHRFQIISEFPLSPGNGDSALNHIEGYSGAGLFKEDSNILYGICVELKDESGINNMAIAVKAELINSILIKNNQNPITEKELSDVPKEKIDFDGYNLDRDIHKKGESNEWEGIFYKSQFNPRGNSLHNATLSHDKIILLGDGGIGKTFELKRLASQLSKDSSIFYPFFIELKNYNGETIRSLLDQNIPNWDLITKPEQLVLIIDGYEEAGKNREIFRKNLNSFLQEFDAKVILSCRNAYFKESEWPNFIPFSLLPLNDQTVRNHAITTLSPNGSSFIDQLELHNLFDVAKIPFYLFELIEIFRFNNDQLPKSRAKIFELLTTIKTDKDEKKYSYTLELNLQTKRTNPILGKLALEMTKRNKFRFTVNELTQILPDNEIISIQEHPLGRISNAEFSFDNEMFKDYFAALALSAQNCKEIFDIILLDPKYRRIVPSFQNVVQFLISIWDEEPAKKSFIINWLSINHPTFLLTIPKSEVSEEIRTKLFKRIFFSIPKGNPFQISFWGEETLGNFGASGFTNQLLIETIENQSLIKIWNMAYRMLRWEGSVGQKRTLKQFLMEKAEIPDHKYNAIFTFQKLNLLNGEESKRRVEELLPLKEKHFQDLAWSLIIRNDLQDTFANPLLKTLAEFVQIKNQGRNHSTDIKDDNEQEFSIEEYYDDSAYQENLDYLFKECLLGFNSQENIIKLLKTCIEYPIATKELFDDQYGLSRLKPFWTKLSEFSSKNPTIFNLMATIFLNYTKNRYYALYKLADFFILSETQKQLIDFLRENDIENFVLIEVLKTIQSDPVEEITLDLLNNAIISPREAEHILYHLPAEERSKFESSLLNASTTYSEAINDRTIYKSNFENFEKRQLNLFFDEEEFNKEINRIFHEIASSGKKISWGSDIARLESPDLPDAWGPFTQAIIFSIQGNYESVSIKQFNSYYSKNRLFIKLNVIQRNYGEKRDQIEPYREQLSNWVEDLFPLLSIPSSNNSNAPDLVYYFWKNYQIKVPNEYLLNLTLHFMNHMGINNLSTWNEIKEAVGYEEFHFKIFENLGRKDLPQIVLLYHLAYCRETGFKDALELISKSVQNNNWISYGPEVLNSAIQTIDTLSKDDSLILENLFLDKDLKGHIKRFLYPPLIRRKSPVVTPFLHAQLNSSENEQGQFDAAVALLVYEDQLAMEFLLEWYERGKGDKYDTRPSIFQDITNLDYLSYLLELIHYVTPTDGFPIQIQGVINGIKGILLHNDQFNEGEKLILELINSTTRGGKSYKQQLKNILEEVRHQYYTSKYNKRFGNSEKKQLKS